jgi:hypothetical protein
MFVFAFCYCFIPLPCFFSPVEIQVTRKKKFIMFQVQYRVASGASQGSPYKSRSAQRSRNKSRPLPPTKINPSPSAEITTSKARARKTRPGKLSIVNSRSVLHLILLLLVSLDYSIRLPLFSHPHSAGSTSFCCPSISLCFGILSHHHTSSRPHCFFSLQPFAYQLTLSS